MSPPPTDLTVLANKLLAEGPVRVLPTSRRIRIVLNQTYIADTTSALLVWEHPYYPQYYIPLSSFADGSAQLTESLNKHVQKLELRANGTVIKDQAIALDASDSLTGPNGLEALRGHVRIQFNAVDWFEEDLQIYVHPKDPFKRVDVLRSSRPIRVFVDGQLVASAAAALHLYETGLPTRYYLPPTAVEMGVLRPSETKTKCPYKGEANYFSVVVGRKTFKDVIWYYITPTLESALIAGHYCFFNEKVDIELDGVMLERPVTGFS